MELGEKLKRLRIGHNYTQEKLGEILGVSTVTIRSWEHGTKKPSADALVSISSALNTSIDELLDTKSSKPSGCCGLSEEEEKLLSNYRVLDLHGKKAVDSICRLEKERVVAETQNKRARNVNTDVSKTGCERFIPRYLTPSAAGSSAPLDGDDFEMMLADDSVPSAADYAVNIQGNSMSPYINDGDMVFVKKTAELSSGDAGIFCVDGAMYCKQYYRDECGNVTLVSANPELRDTNVFIAADSNCSFKLLGKVLLKEHIALPDYLFNG